MKLDLSKLTTPPARKSAGLSGPDHNAQLPPLHQPSGDSLGTVQPNNDGLSPMSPVPPDKNTEPDEMDGISGIPAVIPEPDIIEPWRQKILDMLGTDSRKKYAMIADNITTDPVMISVGIRSIGTFQMEIPLQQYDGLKLLELLDTTVQGKPSG